MRRRRFLDLAASKPGVYFGLVIILAGFLAAVSYFIDRYDGFIEKRSTFLGLNMREGFVALSDLQRINLVVLEALRTNEMSRELAIELDRATDFLYVRADAFRRGVVETTETENARKILVLLEDVIGILDAARADRYSNLSGLSARLIEITDETRRLLFVFLDDQRRTQERLLRLQTEQLQRKTYFLTGVLFFLTLVAGSALLLLLREGRLRQHVEEAERRVQFLAYYDSLTTLPNRIKFQDHVSAHLDSGRHGALAFLDLDNFKGINDSLGHAAGDCVLSSVARVLTQSAEKFGGVAARIAGDEFALFFPYADREKLAFLADEILENMKTPVEFESEQIPVGLSIGIATSDVVSRRGCPNFEELSRAADFCLYQSKSAGRGRFTIFDADLNERYAARRALLTELSGAIERGEIRTWFQPKVRLGDEAVFGFEALCRWRRDGILVSPADFIPIAESSGSIIELDLHVMRQACELLAHWNRKSNIPYTISVNLSALHFRSRAIVNSIEEVLTRSGLAPECLTLEITETVELMDWDFVGRIFSEIRALGCRISIDDFGAGYSSLAYLRAIQADELKIDRSLVREIETSAEARQVLSSVVDLAHSLNLRVIVEGVETEEQTDVLLGLGCKYGQGYLFGKPLPAQRALARHAPSAGLKSAS